MGWWVQTSLDGWEYDTMGPFTFVEAAAVARAVHQAHEGRMGKPSITTKPFDPRSDT